MDDTGTHPAFWQPALLGALIAALGYLGKLVTDFIREWLSTTRKRQARLAELLALLRAGDVTFLVQKDIRDRLRGLIFVRSPELRSERLGFDRLFSIAYPNMAPEELRLHSLVRAYTFHTLKPLNDKLLDWLRSDEHFRGLSSSDHRYGELAVYLPRLEVHLLLWRAKYEQWIPTGPDHCLVYLADEESHGVGFPHGGTALVAALLGHKLPSAVPSAEGAAFETGEAPHGTPGR